MYDETVLEMLAQQPAALNCEHPPTSDEIQQAMSKLKNKAPGESGLTPQVWKVLTGNDETFSLLESIIMEFWSTGITPTEWENGLLRILTKKGDLSLPGNYRGIMLLEAAYKIVCIILHGRLLPIQESLDHEAQCGFRPGRGCQDAVFTVKTYDAADLSNIELGNGSFMPIVAKFIYLGSILARDCRDDGDVAN